MIATVEQVIQSALALSRADRQRIIDELIESCADESGAILDDEWLAEINRRSAEFDAGLATPITWNELKARLQRKE